jgi:hypothetical protein
MKTLIDALPAGSYLIASHLAAAYNPKATEDLINVYHSAGMPCCSRTADEMIDLAFNRFEIVPPGIVQLHEWIVEGMEPTDLQPPSSEEVPLVCGVGVLRS